MMRRFSIATAVALLTASPLATAAAADLAGKWTTDGRYVFSFERVDGAWLGAVVEEATGREFALADIVLGAREHTGERAYRAQMKRVP